MHKLIILPPAAQFLKKIKEKPLKLAFQNPKTGDLSGVYCCDFFYNKTNYGLAYTILEENGLTIVVILAGTHENF